MSEPSPLISLDEIAERLGWSVDQVRDAVKASIIPSYQAGKWSRIRVLRAEFERWLAGERLTRPRESPPPSFSVFDLLGAEVTVEVTLKVSAVRLAPRLRDSEMQGE